MQADRERREIIDELKSAVQGIVDIGVHSRTPADGSDGVLDAVPQESLTEQSPKVRRLLKVVEDVLHHQIKPPLFGHVPKVWKYLENLDKCLPGTSSMLVSVRQYGDSDYARVRLFIRLALNEHALSEYLSALAWNASLTTNYYKEEALLRHEESLDTIFLLLQNLNNFNFVLVLKDKELERPHYWDFVPISGPPAPTKKGSQGSASVTAPEPRLDAPPAPASERTTTVVEMEQYPEAVATTRRTKKRKGRPKRRSITLPSPPSLPREDHVTTETTVDREEPQRDGRQLSNESLHDESSEEEEAESSETSHSKEVDIVETSSNGAAEASQTHDESSSESDNENGESYEDKQLEERLRLAQERLAKLRSELNAVQASVSNVVHVEADRQQGDVSVKSLETRPPSELSAKDSKLDGASSRSASEDDVANPNANKHTEGQANSVAIVPKMRTRKPKRVVSILDATDEAPSANVEPTPKNAQQTTNSEASTPETLTNIEQREDELSHLLENLEAATHQFLLDEGALPPSPLRTPPQPRTMPQQHKEQAPPPGAVSSTSPASSFVPKPSEGLTFEKRKLADGSNTTFSSGSVTSRSGSHFNKAEIASLLTSEIASGGGSIEHHHEFYPTSVIASLSTGDSGYYSPSYIVSSPLSERVKDSRSKSPLGQPSKLHGAGSTTMGSDSDEEQRERTESQFRSKQLTDPTGFLMNVNKKPSKPNSRCPACEMSLADAGILGGIRFCHYSGVYYCPRCHQNQTVVIPACVMQKWDMKEHKVCTWALEYIEANLNRPTLNIATINPRLYKESPALSQMQELRKQLVVIGEFIQTCKDREKLMRPLAVAQREYMIESAHRYSLRDLIDVHKNRLGPFLRQLIEEYVHHITKVCIVCRGKGHFCELCQSEEDLVFPFQQQRASRCQECKSYFHQHCWQAHVVEGNEPCPKCERVRAMQERRQREAQREQELREQFDAMSPQSGPQRRGSTSTSSAQLRQAVSATRPPPARGITRSATTVPNHRAPGSASTTKRPWI